MLFYVVAGLPLAFGILLAVAWFIHVLMHKSEATKMHYLIGLLPVLMLIGGIFSFLMPSNANNVSMSNTWAILAAVDGDVARGVFFMVMGLATSGYCLLPFGMPQGRMTTILGIAGLDVASALLQSFATQYLSLLTFIIAMVELVLIVRWSSATVLFLQTGEQAAPAIHSHGATTEVWNITHHHRVHVAQGIRRSVILYLITIIIGFALGLVLVVYAFAVLPVNPTVDQQQHYLDAVFFMAEVVALIMVLLSVIFYVSIMIPFRMGHSQEYAPLVNPEAGVQYAAQSNGSYAPVYQQHGYVQPVVGVVHQTTGQPLYN